MKRDASDRFHLSYQTSNPHYAVQMRGMSPINSGMDARTRATFGFGASIDADAEVYAWCWEDWRSGPPRARVAKELLFLANAKDRQHQWNHLLDSQLIVDICR